MKLIYHPNDLEEPILKKNIFSLEPMASEKTGISTYHHPLIGNGQYFHRRLGGGVGIFYHTMKVLRDSLFTQEIDHSYLSLGFIFSGLIYHNINQSEYYKKEERTISLALIPDKSIWIYKLSALKEVVYARIYMDPGVFRTLIAGCEEELPEDIKKNLESNTDGLIYKTARLHPGCAGIFSQMMQGEKEYDEKIYQLYLESKVMELIALHLGSFKPCRIEEGIKLSPIDIAKIYDLRDIIVSNTSANYSLEQLSINVGLNTFKLKTGFKKIFGTSIFRYMHDHRMDEAKKMLKEKNLNVSEVADSIGYQTIGAFSNAFYKKFRIRPTDIKSKC
jgi:AraC-like DNA-binding protein